MKTNASFRLTKTAKRAVAMTYDKVKADIIKQAFKEAEYAASIQIKPIRSKNDAGE